MSDLLNPQPVSQTTVNRVSTRSLGRWDLTHAFWPMLAYVIVSLTTRSYFLGDTIDYSDSIVAQTMGRNYYFWEFGHLLWRPFGWVVFRITEPLLSHIVGANARTQATLVLVILSWLSGLLSVFSLNAVLRRVCVKPWVPLATTLAFIFALSFLNYFHSGTPYIPGLSMVALSLYILTSSRTGEVSHARSICAGVSLALGICFWFPYVVVSPAVVLTPAFVYGINKRRIILAVQTLMLAGLVTVCAYFAIAGAAGVRTPAQFKTWMHATSGDSAGTPNKGATKAIFGFARAFVSMGNDGPLFKRYLIKDPLNPVSIFELFRFSLWKLLAFYLFLLAIGLSLLFSPKGRQILGLLLVACVPGLAFAVYWQGGDPERYLALFPFIFLSAAVSLDVSRHTILRWSIVAFMVGASVVNLVALSTVSINRQENRSASRVAALAETLTDNSRVVTANWQDDLVNFSRTFPFNAINQRRNVVIESVITPGSADVERWRQSFGKSAMTRWNNGGDVWLSKRLFAQRPLPEWSWVEGDDPRVSWTDLYKFFSQLELGQSIGGDDGFVLLLPSDKNKQVLSQYN